MNEVMYRYGYKPDTQGGGRGTYRQRHLPDLKQNPGRDEQAMLVSVAGAVIVFLMLVRELGTLIDTIRKIFSL